MFQTNVFPIPVGESRTLTLRYVQICPKSRGLVDFLFPLRMARFSDRPLEKISLRATISSSTDVKSIYSPSHEVDVDRSGDRHAVVTFKAKEAVPTNDFRLLYDAKGEGLGASVVSYRPQRDEDGYFLLLATPPIEPSKSDREQSAKTVVFVVDRSGSMSGEKMEQARSALLYVLDHLQKGDTFNIVAYDSEVEAFRPELQKADEETREAAKGFVNGLFAGGSTNIDGALNRAFDLLQDDERPAYVIFLTDGLPTVGESREAAIVKHAAEANKVRARLMVFGVGYDVNSRLLDKLSHANHGRSEYVRPEEDIDHSVRNMYRRLGSAALTDVQLSVDVEGAATADGPAVSRVYPRGPLDLFAGDQAVIVGRYRAPGHAKVKLSGSLAGKDESFDFPAEFTDHSDDDGSSYVAKLWATRRVGEIIDEIDLKGKNDELVKELVDLAAQHGILTPYTSFLADESARAQSAPELYRGAAVQLESLQEVEGAYAFRQRAAKGALQRAEQPADAALAARAGGYADSPSADAAGSTATALAASGGRGVAYYDARQDKHVVASTVISVGRKTMFLKNGRWIDSTLTEAEEAQAEPIERYSREYFDLVDRHGRHVAQYLAIDGPVVIKLDGRIYSW
jgi:Ca-activated chloride channel family protein